MTAGAPLAVLIVDDEPPAREVLRALLAADPEVTIAGECGSGPEAVEAIRRHRPDLVLLDVQMPELDGFGVLAALEPDELPLVVFVTAYDRHALRAFEVHALDYLLKPFEDERFAEALGRAKARARQRDVEAVSRHLLELLGDRGTPPPAVAGGGFATRLLVRSAGRVAFVKVREIDWIEAADYYARIHAGGARHLIRESLASLERRLDPGRFARVHRSAIVNLDRVRELQPLLKGSYAVVLADGTRLPLARQRRAQVEARLAGGR